VRGRGRALALASLVAAGTCAAALVWPGGGAPAAADPAVQVPPIRHVFVINLENFSFRDSFDNNFPDRAYLAGVLRSQGVLLENYYGIGHNSLGNYIAQISGQGPNPDTQTDCGSYDEFVPEAPADPNGQAVGQGCVYPTSVKTLPEQMDERHLTWKGYMEDMGARPTVDGGFRCAHPPVGGFNDASNKAGPDKYATKHNPFMYFHSIIDDDAACRQHVAPLDELFSDLQRVDTTPNLAYITPNNCNDGHDGFCTGQYTFDGKGDSRLPAANRYMAWLVPRILASPAYREDGMVVVTFDEAETTAGVSVENGDSADDSAACCNQIPGPNSPLPGITGPGGGKTGTIILSPYVQPGTEAANGSSGTAPDAYNHYSLLRSLEDLFGVGHLGFAATTSTYPGPGSFGNDVYNRVPGVGGVQGDVTGPAPRDATPGQQPVGPRAADGAAPPGNNLNAVSCAAPDSCVAVGDTGTALVRQANGSWSSTHTGTASDLLGVSCHTVHTCAAVGRHGVALSSDDGGLTWNGGVTPNEETLADVSCPSSSVCFAVGDGGAIEQSQDGGANWAELDSGVTDPLAGIDCPSASTCMTTGGEQRPVDLVTRDGGGTWSVKVPSTDNGTGVSCSSSSRCTVSTPNNNARWTTDGGATWNGFATTQNPNRMLGVACPSDTTCFVAANRGGVFKLDETAKTFTAQTPGKVGDDLNDIACPGSTRCYAVGEHGQILETANGSTWTSKRTGPLAKNPGETDPSAVSTLRAMSCTGSGACVAVGDEGSVATKADAGAEWEGRSEGASALPLAPNLFGVSCTDAGTCVAVGSYDTILRSTDGGESWDKRPSPLEKPSGHELRGATCFAESDCVAVGAYGEILRSDDAGSSWDPIGSPTPYSLNGVGCSAGGTCAAVGSMGAIVTSGDGGRTWSEHESGTLGYLAGASCPTDSDCLAVGQNGLVLGSHDGGSYWTRQDSGVDDGLNAVDCSSASSCTATGSAGTVVETADGGESWEAAGTGTAGALNGVDCAPTGGCQTAGEGAAPVTVAAKPKPHIVPRVSAADATIAEGDDGARDAHVSVRLSSPSPAHGTVAVDYATADASGETAATPNADYTPVSGTLIFAPGESERTIDVPIAGDRTHEPNEDLAVALSNPQGATIDDGQATVTIVDDDVVLASVGDLRADEGAGEARFDVSLSTASSTPVTVRADTEPGTATPPDDFGSVVAREVVFAPGETHGQVAVPLTDDVVDEPDESFGLRLSDPRGAALARAVGVATIGDDDPPSLSVSDAVVPEGDDGTRPARFVVTLSAPASEPVGFHYAAVDGSATVGDEDYEPTSGDATIPAGSTTVTVDVPVRGDGRDEPDETFSLILSDPRNATLAPESAGAIGTILDDDPTPQPAPAPTPAPAPAPPAGSSGASGSSDSSSAPRVNEPPSVQVAGVTENSPCTVPKLTRKRLPNAVRRLTLQGCVVGKVIERRSRKRPGTVIAQRPRPGTSLPSGSKITLVVSRARKPRAKMALAPVSWLVPTG
jgi:phosphatidylinositol-3-phosphatase